MKSKDKVGIKGFYRLNIMEPDKNGKVKVVGDSGWVENTVVNYGFEQITSLVANGTAAGVKPTHLALGTGTAPGVSDTALEGEIDVKTDGSRMTVSTSVVSSKTLRMTGSLNSNIIGGASTIKNIGVFGHSSSGTVMSGNTYATSQLATNQTVNATYEWRFA
jgi:hypothetical protein